MTGSINNESDLMRLVTLGSVDDGKSTLIGRLLLDSHVLPADQVATIRQQSLQHGDDHLDLSLFTDGLKAEQEQGITIDVAYRYFSTSKRRFILADCPGHLQYTRNMITGASTADVALIIVDAQKGISEQTRRHLYIAALLQIQHLIICINKMDLVSYNEDTYNSISTEARAIAKAFGTKIQECLPISALLGDNVVQPTANMPWYAGQALFELLEQLPLAKSSSFFAFRFPVQNIIRTHHEPNPVFRGYAGRIENGVVKVGQKVTVLPSGLQTSVATIQTFDGELSEAASSQSVVISFTDELDISRGDLICDADTLPKVNHEIEADLCWLIAKPLQPGNRFLFQHTTNRVKAIVKEIHFAFDLQKMEADNSRNILNLNDIGRVSLKISAPIFYDAYTKNRNMGAFILIDEQTNQTCGAGLIL